MEGKELVKIKPHGYFTERFFKKLAEPISVVEPLTTLCGGWYLETFKQVINKLNKNKSSPLPLVFASIDAMDPITKNKQLLRRIFKAFDTRGYNKVDGCELYSAFLAMSKGSYETYLKTIVDVFGFETPGKITRQEFFFFLDSFYRALPKTLISREKGDTNVRLDFKDINRFLVELFEEEKGEIERNEIYEAMMKVQQLNQFLKYVQKRCISSAETSRAADMERAKTETEVRKCLVDMILEVQRTLDKK